MGLLLAGSLPGPGGAAEAPARRPTIGVLEFKYAESGANTGAHLANEIIHFLARSGYFEVLERERLRALLDEAGIPDEMLQKADPNIFGRLRGCDFLMFGSIHVLQDGAVGMGNRKNAEVTLQGDYRVSDVSGSLKHTGEFNSRVLGEPGSWISGSKPTWQRYEKLTKVAVSAAAGSIAWDLITQLAPLRITGVDASDKVTVNYGKPFLSDGNALVVYRGGNREQPGRPLGYLVVDYASDGWARCVIHSAESGDLHKRLKDNQWADLLVHKSEILPAGGMPRTSGGEWVGQWHTRRMMK
jgi:hypothetical protein